MSTIVLTPEEQREQDDLIAQADAARDKHIELLKQIRCLACGNPAYPHNYRHPLKVKP